MTVATQQQLSVRRMQASDLADVVRIEAMVHDYPWTRGNFADSMQAGHDCWTYTEQYNIVGYAVLMMVLDEAHLLNISIAKEYQAAGRGYALLQHLMQLAKQAGAANMFLEVRQSNLPAIRLYERTGFNEMGIRRNYYPARTGREDAILMGMAL
ncbi:ribosomal protein S18-alanine N-acetyltransferase [Methylobacillus flagellatus]|uniref:ribosomal protein S18-alanine N-acetyltransferase n=1 Tax=Methylobacillus flagellatus TaxID=405 RepID=UPI002570E770|nr:ribosomal protein S18-alanine N-acetyltransferase [Methylobacillus flagellatus]